MHVAMYFGKILEIISYHKSSVIVLENVKNLTSHDDGDTFRTIYSKLEALGYFIKYAVLNTCEITNVPQNRERIYIVCFKTKEMYDVFCLFDDIDKNVLNKSVMEFLEEDILKKYYYDETSAIYSVLNEGVLKTIDTNTVCQYRRYYVRENKAGVCPTLTANMGTGGHNVPIIRQLDGKIRKLTPRECFNLQGFPKEYKLPKISDGKLYSLAGNAVSIHVVQIIADKIVEISFNQNIGNV